MEWVENQINNRPRKKIGDFTPNEKINQIISNLNSASGTFIKSQKYKYCFDLMHSLLDNNRF